MMPAIGTIASDGPLSREVVRTALPPSPAVSSTTSAISARNIARA